MKICLFFVTLFFVISGSLNAAGVPFFIAHRGNSSIAPENTMEAFRAAWNNGLRYIEVDVRQSADNIPFCLHDSNLRRVSPEAPETRVSKMTMAEIRKYDVGSWKGAKFAGAKVPLLEEVFAEAPAGTNFVLDIKSVRADFPVLLKKLLKKHNISPGQITILSYNVDILRKFKTSCPDYHALLAFVSKGFRQKPGTPLATVDDLIESLQKSGADGTSIGVHRSKNLDREFIKKVNAAGFTVQVWTIDDPKAARKYLDMGAIGVTTNKPLLLRENLQKKTAQGK